MALFSQRKGINPLQKDLQIEDVDKELRNQLWSMLCIFFWDKWHSPSYSSDKVEQLYYNIWLNYLKKPIDEKPFFKFRETNYSGSGFSIIKKYFFSCSWYEVYDFLEFVVKNASTDNVINFMKILNTLLEKENSAYRFIGLEAVAITDVHEIESIETAITSGPEGVRIHLQSALRYLSDRKNLDFRNSIKESISSVESLCNLIAKNSRASLGDALKKIKDKVNIHPALERGFSSIYGYTSDESGIRHALMEEPNITFTDAKFILSACAAFVNYLLGKCAEISIEI